MPPVIGGLALASRLVPGPVRRRAIHRVLAGRVRDPDVLPWIASEIEGHDPGAIIQAGRALSRFSSRDWIGKVDVPAAVVVTEQDGMVPPSRQRKLAMAIPGATVHSVDGDHGACAYRPRQFATALLEACASVLARSAAPRV
jgi:pimeloyl-ACP methyl ester carboxylesterase